MKAFVAALAAGAASAHMFDINGEKPDFSKSGKKELANLAAVNFSAGDTTLDLMNFGLEWNLHVSAVAGWSFDKYTIWREWTPYLLWEIPAVAELAVEQDLALYLGPVGLNFEIEFIGVEAGLETLYSTNRNMPGHQCYRSDWLAHVGEVEVKWGTMFQNWKFSERQREIDLAIPGGTYVWDDQKTIGTSSLPVPLFATHLLEDLSWGGEIMPWTCNDFDFLNLNMDAAKADPGAQPVPEDPNEWVDAMELFGEMDDHHKDDDDDSWN